jgi:hypothetical protein
MEEWHWELAQEVFLGTALCTIHRLKHSGTDVVEGKSLTGSARTRRQKFREAFTGDRSSRIIWLLLKSVDDFAEDFF